MSMHRKHGIYIVNGHICRDLFGPNRSPYNGCMQMSNVCCRIVNVYISRKGVGVRNQTSRTIILPFDAVRRTCGVKGHVSIVYCAIGPKGGMDSLRPRVRTVLGRTRCVSPSSGRTIVGLGTRTVFSVVSGLFANVRMLV